MYRRRPTRKFAVSQRLILLGSLGAIALALAILPPTIAEWIRAPVEAALGPGQRSAARVRRGGERWSGWVRAQLAGVEHRAHQERETVRLRTENRRLRAELGAAQLQIGLLAENTSSSDSLLVAKAIRSRVLGVQARSYLARHLLIDAGHAAGIEPGAVVIEEATEWVDKGSGSGVAAGQVVLAGSRVWGKVVAVGAHTSSVCRMTEPDFRDVVRLATPSAEDRPARWGAKGVLEGTGDPLARLRMIAATEPVAEGDLVCSLAGEGFVEEPLVCGRVVRVERPHGATHWEIWVEPAAGDSPGELTILRPAANPVRWAEQTRTNPADWR